MKYKKSTHMLVSLICLTTLIGNLVVRPGAASAVAGSGQLTFAKQVTINGNNASSGQTVFNGNKIRVGSLGAAVINLGRLGRVELGANSEMSLRVSDGNIGGTLITGCLAITAPAGEGIEIETRGGKIRSAGKQSSSLFLGIKGNTANVYPNLGEISVTAGEDTELAKPGELLALTGDGSGGANLRRMPKGKCGEPGVLCACDAGSLPSPPASPAASANNNGIGAAGLAALLFSAALGTSAVIFGLTNNTSTNGSGLTCVNTNSLFCKPTSPTTP